MPEPFDPAAIVEVLNRHGVRYVVIGGYAANVHGAVRPTLDIDVTPQQTHENLERLVAAITELEAKYRTEHVEGGLTFSITAEDLANGTRLMLNLETKHGELDISMVPQGTDGYDDLIRGARRHTLRDGVSAEVASLADVIRSKETADRPKDRAALPELRRLVVGLDDGPTAEELAAASRAQNVQVRPGSEATRTLAQDAGEDVRSRVQRYLRERDSGHER